MFRFSHMDSKSRSKLSRCLTLVFVLSIFIHGATLLATAIWMAVVNIFSCGFLQKYYVPIFFQLAAGVCAISMAVLSVIFTAVQRTSSFIRLFLCGVIFIVAIELACMISAGVMDHTVRRGLQERMTKSIATIITNRTENNDLGCWRSLQDSRHCCGSKIYTDWCPNASNYTQCIAQDGSNFLDSCTCKKSCVVWNDIYLHSASCYDVISGDLRQAYKVSRIVTAVFFVLQVVTYWALYCILPRLHTKAVVDTYKPKPAEIGLEDKQDGAVEMEHGIIMVTSGV